MAKVSKTIVNGKFRYINVLDIDNDNEHEQLYQKIKQLIEDDQ